MQFISSCSQFELSDCVEEAIQFSSRKGPIHTIVCKNIWPMREEVEKLSKHLNLYLNLYIYNEKLILVTIGT